MSRITGNDAYGLMEAYSAVYQPRLELTEEQVWEEVEEWVNALIEEGYDLSDYTWEEMYDAYIEEARAEGVKPYKPQPLKPLPQAKPLSGQRGDGSGYKDRTGKTEGPLITVNPGNPEEARKALEKTKQKPHTRTGNPTRIMSPNLSTTREVDAVRGMVQGRAINNPTASSLPRGSSAKPRLSREIIRRPQAEQVDVYDIILSHLLDEGYANSVDAAEVIMVNMSEEWISSIMIDEGVTLAQYKRKRQEYKDSQSGRRSSRVGLGPAGSEWRVERDMETRGAFGTGEYGGTTKNPKKLRKQRAMGEVDEGVTLAQYKRKRQEYKDSQSGRRSSRVGLGPAGSEARVERDMETRGAFGTGEYGGTTKNPKKLRKQRAMGEVD